MKEKNERIIVLGIYQNRSTLEQAVNQFKNSGFRHSDISALLPAGDMTKDFVHEKGSKASEGATSGVVSGAALGGVLGWLAGIGTLAIPGVGPFIAAGPILAAFAGAGVGGAVGGTAGALIGMGIPEYEAVRYEGRMKKGGHLLSVHCDNAEWETKAKNIFESTNAQDVSSTKEASSESNARDTRRAAGF